MLIRNRATQRLHDLPLCVRETILLADNCRNQACALIVTRWRFAVLLLLLLAVWRIADERLCRDRSGVAVAGADNRDIVDSVDRDARVARHSMGQRSDLFTMIVDDVHCFIPPV